MYDKISSTLQILYQTHTHPFNGPFSGTTQVSQYQKGKTHLDLTEARDSERQWHQLGHMQVCTLLQTDNHASTPPLSFFTGRMPFLPPNQQRQSTEGKQTNSIKQKIQNNIMCSALRNMGNTRCKEKPDCSPPGYPPRHLLIGQLISLQCSDAVGWAAGRASGL